MSSDTLSTGRRPKSLIWPPAAQKVYLTLKPPPHHPDAGPVMKNLPQVHYWTERIDADVIAVHAVRGWGDRPSNGVFLLMHWPIIRSGTKWWQVREDARAELERRLKERERILLGWFGPRDWRNHLCARIIWHGQTVEVRDDFEFA